MTTANPESLRLSAEQFKSDLEAIQRKTMDSLVIALGYWRGFPLCVEGIVVASGDAGWRKATGGPAAYYALAAVHIAAADLLVEAAERFGIDGGSLASSARLCADLFREDWLGQQLAAGTITSDRPGSSCAWPDILGGARRLLTEDERRIVTAGEEAIARLCAKLDIDADEPNRLMGPGLPRQSEADAWADLRDRLAVGMEPKPAAVLRAMWPEAGRTANRLSQDEVIRAVWGPASIGNDAVRKAVERLEEALREPTRARLAVVNIERGKKEYTLTVSPTEPDEKRT